MGALLDHISVPVFSFFNVRSEETFYSGVGVGGPFCNISEMLTFQGTQVIRNC